MTDDRVLGTEFALKQEFLSYMLAVRRPDVSIAAAKLQKDGLIRYSRGVIHVLDRVGLEAAACECYSLTRASHEQVYD
jgi:Mn-dependent DtxR family transcriptional regulator